MEVLSLIGELSLTDADPQIHAHVVLGRAEATARGGHLIRGIVRPTLEVSADRIADAFVSEI